MTVLIASQNKTIIHNYFTRPVFSQNTANTCTFKATKKQIERAILEMKKDGYNPYALMTF